RRAYTRVAPFPPPTGTVRRDHTARRVRPRHKDRIGIADKSRQGRRDIQREAPCDAPGVGMDPYQLRHRGNRSKRPTIRATEAIAPPIALVLFRRLGYSSHISSHGL